MKRREHVELFRRLRTQRIYTIPDGFRVHTKSHPVCYEPGSKASRVHTSRALCRSSWLRGFGTLNPNPHFRIFTSVFEWVPGLSPTYFSRHGRHGPNTCSDYTKVRHRTYPICDTALLRYRGAALLS